MKYLDVTYTNGVIAAREKYLLKEKLLRFCELNAEEAFRALLESGFGGGAETATSVYDYETLIAAEEEKLDLFIREYAPSEIEKKYLFSPRDFHNAKAFIKATYLNADVERMLAPEGMIPIEVLQSCVQNKDYTALETYNSILKNACEEAEALLEKEPSGSKLGDIFEKAVYRYLYSVVSRRSVLKKLLIAKADMTNILTAFRCGDQETAESKYLPIGKLKTEDLTKLFYENVETVEKAFARTDYADFVKQCLEAKAKGLPLTQAERLRDGYDTAYFMSKKYDLQKNEPFLYYVYRRRMESANVRIIFVCLLAGMSEQDIKNRLRVW